MAIRELLESLNFLRRLSKSRRELFETIDMPNAQSLPERSGEPFRGIIIASRRDAYDT